MVAFYSQAEKHDPQEEQRCIGIMSMASGAKGPELQSCSIIS